METSADSHTKVRIRSPTTKGSKSKKANNERDRCKKCGKITNPPHWAKSCPEASSSAQIVLTSHPFSSSSEVVPPGLSAPANNSANSEHVEALAAIFRDGLSPGWIFLFFPSDEPRDSCQVRWLCGSSKNPMFAARDQTKHLSMVLDSGAEWIGVSRSQTSLAKRDEVDWFHCNWKPLEEI